MKLNGLIYAHKENMGQTNLQKSKASRLETPIFGLKIMWMLFILMVSQMLSAQTLDNQFREAIAEIYQKVHSEDEVEDTELRKMNFYFPDYLQGYTSSARKEVSADVYHLVHPFSLIRPRLFHVAYQSSSENIYQIFNQSLVSILRTSAGKTICQAYSKGKASVLAMDLGLSAEAANEIRSDCGFSFFGSLFQPSDIMAGTRSRAGANKYRLLLFDGEDFPFYGWTEGALISYVSVNATNPDYNSFLRTLVHETYQTVDIKSNWQTDGTMMGLYQGSNSCLVSTVLKNPYIRLVFSVLRSEKVEEAVLRELGRDAGINSTAGSCLDRVSRVLPYIQFYGILFEKEIKLLQLASNPNCPLQFTDLNLDDILKILEQEKIQLPTGSQTLCEYLETPQVGLFRDVNQQLRKGPRPNVGDGSGVKSKTKSENTGSGSGQPVLRPYQEFSKDFKIKNYESNEQNQYRQKLLELLMKDFEKEKK